MFITPRTRVPVIYRKIIKCFPEESSSFLVHNFKQTKGTLLLKSRTCFSACLSVLLNQVLNISVNLFVCFHQGYNELNLRRQKLISENDFSHINEVFLVSGQFHVVLAPKKPSIFSPVLTFAFSFAKRAGNVSRHYLTREACSDAIYLELCHPILVWDWLVQKA